MLNWENIWAGEREQRIQQTLYVEKLFTMLYLKLAKKNNHEQRLPIMVISMRISFWIRRWLPRMIVRIDTMNGILSRYIVKVTVAETSNVWLMIKHRKLSIYTCGLVSIARVQLPTWHHREFDYFIDRVTPVAVTRHSILYTFDNIRF